VASASPRLRFTTWLSPGLPLELFEVIAEHVSRGLGRSHELSVESKTSGPLSVAEDRFAAGLTDVGFICAPSYLWLTDRPQPSVSLVGLAPVHDDPRNAGRPVYLSDVVTRVDADIRCFADLRGRRVGFNERASLSGFVSLLAKLHDEGQDIGFFGELREVGSHRQVLALIEAGELDAAAIDANVWQAWCRERADGGTSLRSVDVLGPFPVQPVVVRAGADDGLAEAVADQLAHPALTAALRSCGILGFGPVTHDDYARLRPVVGRAMAMISG
jgi:ABC-type phosphate/phosphonate transport system substrate-binding protein